MAEILTPQQQQAVNNRGGNLLVSAAAGSGKTKVLVDRLMGYILDENDPADLDEFLIITYTKAAASELRGKIAAKLAEHLAQMPENRHLQKQMQRLCLTKISTVHGFCADILREYAYKLDLPADFRVADENECRQLRDTAMERMLEEAYARAEQDGPFRAFVDGQGLGRSDRLVPEILLKVYDSARCHLNPHQWLDGCIANTRFEELTDVGQTLWGQALMDQLFAYLDMQIAAMARCAELAKESEGMEKPGHLLESTVRQLMYLRQSESWDQILQRKNVDFGRLVFSKKCPDQDLAERIKAVRNACKKGLEKKLKIFADSSRRSMEDIAGTADAVQGMCDLTIRFEKEYDRIKRSRRIVDFSDLEHRMLDLLLGKNRSGATAVAREIGQRFREIMVDEYQDSNAVQDAIFRALSTKQGNCFMVGDVKQSIYQFRLADPGIFLEKYNAYAPVEGSSEGEGRKVMLSANFRSGGGVLNSVNDIFRLCMSPEVGGLYYGEAEALREGMAHTPLGEAEVELYGIDVQNDTYAEEAEFVAKRIAQLLDGSHYVRQKDQLRPIQPEDIAILLRSPGSVGGYYMNALNRLGIRCASGGGEDLLQTKEIQVLRSLLQIISNPRQDIPLVAALASPVFAFTADDLASVRKGSKICCIYDALVSSDLPKAKTALQTIAWLRKKAGTLTLVQLIQEIYKVTRLDSIFAAMDGGQTRSENLQAFYTMVSEYESGQQRDLGQFLEHLEAMEEKGLIVSGDSGCAGAVTLMSIHKSKGLEFPVVIVAGLSREFNRESVRAQVLCDQKLGLGLSAVDGKNRLRYPTVAKRAIAAKITADSLSEEMRVLYVALTRARDRLIMTYASRSLEKDIGDIALRMDLCDSRLLTSDVVCPGEWVLMAALRRTEASALFALGGRPQYTQLGDPVWKIATVTAEAEQSRAEIMEETPVLADEKLVERLRKGLSFRYGHTAATIAPSKQTATQRKSRIKDAEAAENTAAEKNPTRFWRRPAFVGGLQTPETRGNATHAVMQHIRHENCTDEAGVKAEIGRLVSEGYITQEEGVLVNCGQIAAFFASDIGRRIREGKEVLREFKFSVLDPAENFDPALQGEQILLQGVVDCALVEDDGIVILDFKTDRLKECEIASRAEFYRPQVEAYADAMERIFEKPVKEALLYFFHTDTFIKIR